MADFSLDESHGYLINLAAQRLKFALHQAFQAAGLDVTPEQWAVLNRLWEQDGIAQVELAERTFKDKPSTTRIVALVERKGLVVRRVDEDDRRVQRVYLTSTGKALRDPLVACAQAALTRSTRGLAKRDLSHLKHMLRLIIANLE